MVKAIDNQSLIFDIKEGKMQLKEIAEKHEYSIPTVKRIKKISEVPVVVGFGIANSESAKLVLGCADGFVVGSAFVSLMAKSVNPKELKCLAAAIDPRQS